MSRFAVVMILNTLAFLLVLLVGTIGSSSPAPSECVEACQPLRATQAEGVCYCLVPPEMIETRP